MRDFEWGREKLRDLTVAFINFEKQWNETAFLGGTKQTNPDERKSSW